jgi:DNA-binding NarL/FixJ family response regulator
LDVLLLLDLGLPDSQGLDGLLRFRADFSRAKVVIVSSQDTPKPTAVNLRKIGTASQTTELLWREVQL